MDIYTQVDLPDVWETIKQRLADDEVCIMPTDTIYGLTGNALSEKVVNRILQIKGRSNPPSFIPHSVEWARLLIADEDKELFDRYFTAYRGRYTTLWRYSDKMVRLPYPLRSSGLVGLRLPRHWITDFAHRISIPLITTSANIHQSPHITGIKDIPGKIKDLVDFMVFEGSLPGSPSTIVHCYEGFPFREEVRR